MRFFTIGIAVTAYRSFSTKGSSKPSSGFYNKYKNKGKTTEKRQRGTRIQWTEEQKSVLSAVTEGHSMFITGSAGTGKTKLLTEVVKSLKKLHNPSKVFVTASTGVAALALKGQTLHSFAGIGVSPADDPEHLLDRVLTNRRACRRWQKVQALVIDEISLVDARLFDNLEYIAKNLRGVDKTWGGIQLIVSGDFFQLPPIPDNGSQHVKYAFEANCWNESFDLQIELTKIFRQTDLGLIKLLQGIRMGESDHEDLKHLLESCCSETECDPSVVQLFPLNKNVKRVNEERLKGLKKEVVEYTAIDDGEGPWKRQLSQGIAADKLSICEEARVMLVKNLSPWKGLVNGVTGTVVGFYKAEIPDVMCLKNQLPIVKFDSGKTLKIEPEEWHVMEGDKVVASRKQIPLILAWALSIHKCQGMTLDRAYINLSGAFGWGMVYTALSRLRSFQGLHLSEFKPSKIRANPKASKFYRHMALRNNNNGLEVSCMKSTDSSTSITGVSAKVDTAEPKLDLLSQFLSRRLKGS